MIKKSILRIAVIIFLLALWAVGDWFGLFNPVVFPPLNEVGSALLMILDRPEFSSAFMATLLDSMKGVIYAAVIAIPSGIIIGMFPSVEKATRILLEFGRSFPVVALMPIFVLIIGATSQMKVVMVSIARFFSDPFTDNLWCQEAGTYHNRYHHRLRIWS
jgi:ABC-type nitrate/sulfonate/bicarbonate transport system permease component